MAVNPPPPGTPITGTVYLCPRHQAEQDLLLAKYGANFIRRTTAEGRGDA